MASWPSMCNPPCNLNAVPMFHDQILTVRSELGHSIFCTPPLFGPLLFENVDSDARDHCANERSRSPPDVLRGNLCLPRASSLSLVPSSQRIYGHCEHCYSHILPPEIGANKARIANGSTPRHNILVFELVLSRDGIWELYQDCTKV
jgi:hypothetical protein